MFLSIYIACLTFGVFYSFFAIFMSDHGGVFDSHDIDHGGTDGGISPLKPIVIATFITLFGGFGLIGNFLWNITAIFTLFVAIGIGLVGAASIFYTVVVPLYKSQSNSLASNSSAQNVIGEVITPIPAEGLGEISYVMSGSRYNSPAKSLDGGEINKESEVVIIEINDNIASVIKKPEVKL